MTNEAHSRVTTVRFELYARTVSSDSEQDALSSTEKTMKTYATKGTGQFLYEQVDR